MKNETYFGYAITHEVCRFINNLPILLWVARQDQCVTLRSVTKSGLKQLIKSVVRRG